ncbi:serine/threonine-protein kinase D6PK-like isoform X2 [Miscanthus floridulus]|uniref:serine/threonine-protein kinase D6PK-like isoform X2 n=1 Tax=Miscanthus floridulus TaxID=154761 RepID=UPI00345ADD43
MAARAPPRHRPRAAPPILATDQRGVIVFLRPTVGTHEYLAPEIVSGDGHGSAVDWWTLGIFVFELLYGATPFWGHYDEATLANIVARTLEFPRDRDPPPPCQCRRPPGTSSPRCSSRTPRVASAIKRHPFFGGVNWALLRCTKPPTCRRRSACVTVRLAAAAVGAYLSDGSCPCNSLMLQVLDYFK